MKTQIVQLDTYDDIVSIRDKMAWCKTPRILLVWPIHERVALRPLDLKLLQRHAAIFGSQLGLVTDSDEIHREAIDLGIPVFKSTLEAQREPWGEQRPQVHSHRRIPQADLKTLRDQIRPLDPAWRSHPILRLVFFTLGVMAVLIVTAAFIPKASITLVPVSRLQTITLPVTASSEVQKIFLSGSIPAHQTTVVVAGAQTITVTGQMAIPLEKALGIARFRNLTLSRVTIPVGTVIQTLDSPPIRFVTTLDGEIAAGIDQVLDLPIEALGPGVMGNLDADRLQALESNLGLSVAVTNPDPTSGGSERIVMAPSLEDRDRVKNLLLTSMHDRVLTVSPSVLSPGDQIFPDTIEFSRTLEETYDPPEGQPGSKTSLKMQVEFTIYFASGVDLDELARAALSASSPEDYVPIPGTLTIKVIDTPVTDSAGNSHWRMRVEQKLKKHFEILQAIHLVQGRTLENGRQRLEDALQLSEPPLVTLTPSWWPWLPVAPFRINVITS